MHFAITRKLKLCLKEVEGFYSEQGVEAGPYSEVTFDENEVSLDIPKDGVTVPGGWSLLPLVYPTKLLRENVDNYQPGHPIPACQIQLVWSRVEEQPKQLSYMIRVNGVIPHNTHIRITRNPVLQDGKSGSTVETKKGERSDISNIDTHVEKSGLEPKREKLDDFMENLLSTLYHTFVPSNWKMIGVKLKLPLGPLNSIAARHQHDPQKCMMEMLELWLKRVDPPPSWEAVIEAVQFLGEEKLARELTEKYLPSQTTL